MFKVVLYGTVSFLLLSLNVALADEGEAERLAVPEYQDAPPAEMTGEMPENIDAPPAEMMGELNEQQMPKEMMPEDTYNEGMQEVTEEAQQEAPNEENSNALNSEEGTAQTPEQSQGDQPPMQEESPMQEQPPMEEGAPGQENTQAPVTLSAEEAEAKHAEELELREVGAGEDEVVQ